MIHRLQSASGTHDVRIQHLGSKRYQITCGGKEYVVEASLDGSRLALRHEGSSQVWRSASEGDNIYVNHQGESWTFSKAGDRRSANQEESNAGFAAPMPGKIVELLVEVGAAVEAGDGLLVLEAMKMEHTIRAAQAGRVTAFPFSEGDQVERGQALVVFETDASQ